MQSAEASDGLTFDRRGDRLMRRFAIAQFACRSRSVSGNDRTTDVNSLPKPCSTRPPRPLARSLLIRSPRPAAPRADRDPLSRTTQFTSAPIRDSLILISPVRASKHACFAALVTSPWNDQSEPPASLWFERKRFGGECQPDIHSIQQRTAHGAAHHADVCRGVDQRLALGHCKRLLHIGITMQQFDHVA